MNLAAQRSGSSVRSGDYFCSSISVASIDKNKNSHRKITMTHTQTTYINRIALRVGKKMGASCWGRSPGVSVRKISYRAQTKKNLLKCKQTIQIVTFNVRTLNRISQLPELTASAVEHNIDIICIQEHRYTHNEDIKYQYWQWMDASHCIRMEKLYQCHGRRCRNTYRAKSVKIT